MKELPLSSCALVKHRKRFKDGASEKMHDLKVSGPCSESSSRFWPKRDQEASVKRAISLKQAKQN
jgi:hypothetical protein